MTLKFDENTDIIDSYDVIARIAELESELEQRHADGQFMSDFKEWITNARDDSGPIYAAFGDDGQQVQSDIEELHKLWKLAEQCEHVSDWAYGETLISESYFTDYIEQSINDCYEKPKDFNTNVWPWSHMTMDWEGAANAAKVDYLEVDFGGKRYLIRDC